MAAAAAQAGTPAGRQLARQALLRRGDFGARWSSKPGPSKVPTLLCDRFSPSQSGIVMIGSAASSTFGASLSGPFVSQTAYAYATPAQAATFWNRVVRKRLLACVAESLVSGSSQGVTFKVTSEQLLALPRIAARDAGYRVTGTATTQGSAITVYLDMIVLARGRVVTAITTTNFSQPAARALELRLARKVARRLRM